VGVERTLAELSSHFHHRMGCLCAVWAEITEMKNSTSSSGAVLLLLKSFKIYQYSVAIVIFFRGLYVSLDVFCYCVSTSVGLCLRVRNMFQEIGSTSPLLLSAFFPLCVSPDCHTT
jgi:hypothetical protein